MWWLTIVVPVSFVGAVALLVHLSVSTEVRRRGKGSSGAMYRIVETFKGDDLRYHGEHLESHCYSAVSGIEFSWRPITDKYTTLEQAQEALDKYREKKRREEYCVVVGEIF